MDISDLHKQLPNKKRTLEELAGIISLRIDQNPNFSVLLGAGCSVTSGIRSANDLLNEWRGEFCKEDSNSSLEEQKKHLKKEYPNWYDPNKEYSSLFEKKYDLQKHRRMFVEKEVSGKTPSVGYAYLISLVKDNYFNTLFTTNFDDLINEAFYLYSDLRPIVCAHDSSINSVTITSSRPKIIKLHGDYLFDDIKATIRETESLEQNMKLKFTEFAKDYGLIVVGYSGYDRSIMETISALLKNDAYFNNGIYWCLRNDSEVSEELKKLFWKDKVYFVEIDGFDEMFAQIHASFNTQDNIPISTSSFSRRPSEITQKLLASEYLKNSTSPILHKAYEYLVRESKRNLLKDLILSRDNDESKDKEESLTDDELITRIEIQKLLAQGMFRDAINKGNKAIRSEIKSTLKNNIIKLIIDGHRALGELKEAISRVDELIENEPFYAGNYILKADILINYEEKLKTINKAIEINPYWYRNYYKKANLLFSMASESYGQFKRDTANEALITVDIGLQCDPSLENPCWYTKFNLISEFEEDKTNRIKKKNEILDKLNIMNPDSIVVLKLSLINLLDKSKQIDYSELEKLIDKINEIKQRKPIKAHPAYEEVKFSVLRNLDNEAVISRNVTEIQSRYDITRYPDLAVEVAQVMRKKLGKDEEAINLLRNCYRSEFDPDVVSLLINSLIDMQETEEARAIYDKTSHLMSTRLNYDLKLTILEAENNYPDIFTEIANSKASLGHEDPKVVYYLLKNNDALAAKNKGKEFLDKINFSIDAVAEIVNYELARKKLKEKHNETRLKELMEFDPSPQVKAAVYSILNEKKEMTDSLKKAIEKDKTFRFSAQRWPVFDEHRGQNYFIDIVKNI